MIGDPARPLDRRRPDGLRRAAGEGGRPGRGGGRRGCRAGRRRRPAAATTAGTSTPRRWSPAPTRRPRCSPRRPSARWRRWSGCDSLDEAIELANSTRFGLGANVYTEDMKTMLRCMRELKAGTVWFNDPLTDNDAGPFGGFKQSGLGRELGREGLEAFQETKHVHIETGDREEGLVVPVWQLKQQRGRCATTSAAAGWRPPAAETLEDRNPATGELTALVPLSGAADIDAAARAAREAQPAWRAVAPQKRARAVIALREALWERQEDIARLVTEDMGKTLDDARGEVAARDRVDRGRLRDPAPAQGREPRGRRARRRRRARAPAGRRGRRDHPVQLPGDDPALVPALRDRLRQHVHPQAVRARPAPVGADLRADRRDRRSSPTGCSTSSTAPTTRSTACSTTPRSTRSRSSARPRPPATSPSARPPPASASRRSAGRRTRSS